jgi:hypothetical protein
MGARSKGKSGNIMLPILGIALILGKDRKIKIQFFEVLRD